MCLITLAYKAHPEYDLIFAANRDEAYERPTRAAGFWQKHPDILAGKDLQAGGTWMGINKKGFFSAITNYRDPSAEKQNPPSRGHLVLDFLKNSEPPKYYLQNVDQKADQYSGFNLFVGTVDELGYYSNHQKKIQLLEAGIYGLSNGLLNTPWPKVEHARHSLSELIDDDKVSPANLFSILMNDKHAPDEQLPDTGIPLEIERQVSPIFIKGDQYGTRCSTVLLIDKQGLVYFQERRFKAGTQEVDESNSYEFIIERMERR